MLKDFLLRFAVGTVLGVAFGYLLDIILRREWIDQGHVNIFVLAMAMLNFCLADLFIAESGLLSVTVAGLVLGIRRTPQLRDIVSYKVELKDFLIGLLFVLLAANLDLRWFLDYGWELVLMVAAIMFIVRPLNVFASMRGSSLSLKQKLFLSWIAPRGIVAASMASVFALDLKKSGVENAAFLETFTYSVILGTVIVQGFTAGAVGRWLGVVRPVPHGWIIVGAHSLGRQIAKFFLRHGVDVVLIDTNAREVRAAKRDGLVAISEDAMLLNPEAHESLFRLRESAGADRQCRSESNALPTMVRIAGGLPFLPLGTDRLRDGGKPAPAGGQTNLGEFALRSLDAARQRTGTIAHQATRRRSACPLRKRAGYASRKHTSSRVLPASCDLTTKNGSCTTRIGQQTGGLPLVPENVIFSEQTNLFELYREMLHHLHRQLPGIDAEQLLVEMWKREADYTSLLGNGIALPHTWSDAVSGPC